MSTEEVGSAREEAERLVAAGLGAVSTALRDMEARRQLRALAEQVLDSDRVHDLAAGLNGFVAGMNGDGAGHRGSTGFSTGSADCCVCPVCRLIAALRDPSPEFAEQLASAVGDLAVGLVGVLRALSGALTPPDDSETAAESGSNTMSDSPRSGQPGARKPMAKKAVKKAVRRDTGK